MCWEVSKVYRVACTVRKNGDGFGRTTRSEVHEWMEGHGMDVIHDQGIDSSSMSWN